MRIQATKRAMEQKMIRKIPCIKFEMGLSGLLVKIISLPYNHLDLESAECNDAGKKLR